MSSIMMPYISKKYVDINPEFSLGATSPVLVSKSLRRYLSKLKDNIDEVQKDWDVYKKYTNPYECLHSHSFGQSSQPVCTMRPISRSYFKMVEMCTTFDILEGMPADMRSFHIAEGPGGFIEALCHMRNNPKDEYIGMTLISDNPNVPGWHKSRAFLENNKNVSIEVGADGTGDITKECNLLRCSGKYGASVDLVTADGGFDFSGDFNNQESQIGLLLVSQLAMASVVQKKGGTLIMKMFDVFTKLTVDILYIISVMYDRVSIVKPNTSRYANSERYVVAQGFKLDEGALHWGIPFAMLLDEYAKRTGGGECRSGAGNLGITRLLSVDPPLHFISRIEESNATIGQQQMDVISATLALIKNPRQDKMEKMRMSSVQRSVLWCQKHKMPYNRDVRQFNMFLSAKNKVSRVPRRKLQVGEELLGYELPIELYDVYSGIGEADSRVELSDVAGDVVDDVAEEAGLSAEQQQQIDRLCNEIVDAVVNDV